jgi:hypothetical protein
MAADNLLNMPVSNGKSDLKACLPQILAQAIFGLFFKLPNSPCMPIFFSALCSNLIAKAELEGQKEVMTDLIEKSVQLLFIRASSLDRELKERLLDFMANFIFERDFSYSFDFIKEKLEDPEVKNFTRDLV